MQKLYVIGNGFDLMHGLPTKYKCFYGFAQELLDDISGFCFPDSSELWSDFENDLGKLDWKKFYSQHNHIDITAENFKPSMIYGFTDEMASQSESYVDSIQSKFQEWIEDIDLSVAKKCINLNVGSRYLSFNYTSTLQKIYGIDPKNILHIHGSVEKSDKLIFGHDIKIGREPAFDKDGEPTRTPFSDAEDAAKSLLSSLEKPVDFILNEHVDFFGALIDVDNVIVIGHSLNKIDLPYFKKIADCAVRANWAVYYYDDKFINDFNEKLLSCGVFREKIEFRENSELPEVR